ncbi:MAG TPA: formate/nitrite transporter family protein, partial [Nitrospira sp.]|nr:formate/nitrite transporter family protein [Nitrospira sp.]
PTLLFFSQGFEHAVVNMFLMPVGMMLGADVSLSTWWLWNQIPVTLGNLVGGMLFTGLAIYAAHHATAPAAAAAQAPAQPVTARGEQAGYSPSY